MIKFYLNITRAFAEEIPALSFEMFFNYLWLFPMASAMLGPGPKPDVYMTACSGELANFYEFGNETCHAVKIFQRVNCSCPDTRFARSVSVCIDTMVRESANNADQVDETINTSFKAFADLCSEHTTADLHKYLEEGSNLRVYDQDKKKGLEPGKWPVDAPFRLRDEDLFNAYAAQLKSDSAEMTHKWFGSGLLFYWLAIISIKSAVYMFDTLFPIQSRQLANAGPSRWFRRNFIMRPDKYLQLAGITQMQAFVIVTFWALTFIFTYAYLPTWYPNFMYQNRRSYMWGSLIGQRTGILPMYLIPLLILFAGRNNILQWATGWSFSTFIAFHKWIARAVVLLLIEHSIAYTIQRSSSGRYGEMWHTPCWLWGFFGTLASCFLVAHSFRFLKNSAYDLFVVLHIVGVIVFIITGYYHLKLLEDFYGLYYYWAAIGVWGLDRVLRFLRIMASGIQRAAIMELHEDMLVITVKRPECWKLIDGPGKFVCIHFWRPSLLWQSHPFTLVEDPCNPENLKLFCKIHKGATRQIANYVLANHEATYSDFDDSSDSFSSKKSPVSLTGEIPQTTLPVLLDGPYGPSHDLTRFRECIFIAGGSGITAPWSYIQHLLRTNANANQILHLFWAVKDAEQVESFFGNELDLMSKHSSKLSVTICSSKSGTRLDIKHVVHDAIVHSCGPVAVMCCGPTSMCMTTRDAVCDSLSYSNEYVDYFEELFNW